MCKVFAQQNPSWYYPSTMAKHEEQDEILIEGDAHAQMRVYEIGFHLDPELPTEEVKKTYQEIRKVIEGAGTIVAEGEPNKIPLAYTIFRSEQTGRRDFVSAYFCWIAYETDGSGHDAVLARVGEETRVVRFIDLRTDKESAQHSAEMAEIYAKMPSEVEDTDKDVSEVELDAALKEVEVA